MVTPKRFTRESFSSMVSERWIAHCPPHVVAVAPGLLDQMTAVGGRVDQDIVGLCLHTALDDGLQELVLHFKFFKGQVVHIDDEAVVPVFDLGDHIGEILELMFVNLNHAADPGDKIR